MNIARIATGATALLFAMATYAVAQQDNKRVGTYAKRKGYDQADFKGQQFTITTGSGEKTLRVTVSKLRVPGGNKIELIQLPKQGLALIQHSAGSAKIATENREGFAPLEGEWLRIPLPSELRVATENDTVLMDLVVIEEISADRR
jgi:hypothetical protein